MHRFFDVFGDGFWLHFASPLASQIHPESNITSIIFLMPLRIDFGTEFNEFWGLKWRQLSTNMGSKIDADFERLYLLRIYVSPSQKLEFSGARVEIRRKNQ